MTIPAEGWTQPDSRGIVRFTQHGPSAMHAKPPTLDGYEVFFVAVHGTDFTTWAYKPTK